MELPNDFCRKINGLPVYSGNISCPSQEYSIPTAEDKTNPKAIYDMIMYFTHKSVDVLLLRSFHFLRQFHLKKTFPFALGVYFFPRPVNLIFVVIQPALKPKRFAVYFQFIVF